MTDRNNELLCDVISALDCCPAHGRWRIAAKLCEIPQPEDEKHGKRTIGAPRTPDEALASSLIELCSWWRTEAKAKNASDCHEKGGASE